MSSFGATDREGRCQTIVNVSHGCARPLAFADARLAEAVALAARNGRALWPGVRLADDLFAAHVAEVGVDPEDLARFGADLYLACGCVHRDRAALQAFERTVMPVIERHVVRAGLLRKTPPDEIAQILRVWLLADARPRIARYSGRGSLVGWLKIVTARRALKLTLRSRPQPAPLDERTAARLVAANTAPEVAALRSDLRGDFQRALDASVTALSPHARSILRRHYLEGASLDVIADGEGVHRATVARWLAGIRTTIMARLREHLTFDRRPTSSDFRSLAGAVREELHLSLDRLLTAGD